MKTAGIAKLKATLSEYIDYVKSGEEVIVTDRGKPVARISPVDGRLAADARQADLVRRGIVRPGRGPITREFIESLPSANVSRQDIERIIREEREDRL